MSDFDDVRCLDAPLADKLEVNFARLLGRAPEIANAYVDIIERLRHAGAGDAALSVGQNLPEFALPDRRGHVVRMTDLLSGGPLVVSFNRGHWCSFCRLELLALSQALPEIKAHGASLASIMPDTARLTARLERDFQLGFPILTDIDNGYALQAGLMVALGPALANLLRAAGTDLAEFQGNQAWFVPIPATYVVAPSGEIVASHVDPDFRIRMAPGDILAALDRIA